MRRNRVLKGSICSMAAIGVIAATTWIGMKSISAQNETSVQQRTSNDTYRKEETSEEDQSEQIEVTQSDNVTTEDTELIDCTATLKNTFSIDHKEVIQESKSSANFGTDYSDLETLYNATSNIVVGTVKKIEYTDEDAIPRTIYSFQVNETLKGTITTNSLISISESNGYVRMKTFIQEYGDDHFPDITDDEIENGVILEALENAPLPEENEEYVVFLEDQKETGRLTGTYAVIGNFMGKYVLDQDTGLYSRYLPSEYQESVNSSSNSMDSREKAISLEDLKEQILSFN